MARRAIDAGAELVDRRHRAADEALNVDPARRRLSVSKERSGGVKTPRILQLQRRSGGERQAGAMAKSMVFEKKGVYV